MNTEKHIGVVEIGETKVRLVLYAPTMKEFSYYCMVLKTGLESGNILLGILSACTSWSILIRINHEIFFLTKYRDPTYKSPLICQSFILCCRGQQSSHDNPNG